MKLGDKSRVTYKSEPPNVVCTTGLHLTWIQGEHAVLVNIHVKAVPWPWAGALTPGVQIMSSLSISNYYCIINRNA